MKRREIIVPLVLLLLVVGFCWPAVLATRNAELQTACANNLKQLGLGIHNFASTYNGRLPHTTDRTMTRGLLVDRPLEQQASWIYGLHPYVEARMDPKFIIDPLQSFDAEVNRYVIESSFPVLLCPSNENLGPTMNYTHYVGVTGVGRDAAMLPLSDARCGIFAFERTVKFEDIKDGTANTFAVIETATDNGLWAIGGHSTARGVDPDGTDYLGAHGQFSNKHGRGFPAPMPFMTFACFADGSVHRLRESVAPAVVEALATIAGGETVPPLDE
jgi:hypothetical protein